LEAARSRVSATAEAMEGHGGDGGGGGDEDSDSNDRLFWFDKTGAVADAPGEADAGAG